MSLNFCPDAIELVCSNLYTNYFLPSEFVHEFRKFAYEFFLLFSRIRTRICMWTLYTKFVIFDKLGKSSYEFARIREGYVTNGLYCRYHILWAQKRWFLSIITINWIWQNCTNLNILKSVIWIILLNNPNYWNWALDRVVVIILLNRM